MTDKLWLYRHGNLEDIFLKTNKVRLSRQGKQLTISVANNKIGAFKQKVEFGKRVSVIMSLTAFKYLKYFSNEISGDIN